ncbi:MAG TPA: hypothetical protein VJ653_09035, partial [Acidimicrobiales bacterium]|nr:hypothetical protein [Acidimicrobiales bacterium]
VRPVTSVWGDGFYGLAFLPAGSGHVAPYYPRLAGQSTARLAQATASVELTNPLTSVRPVELTFGLVSATGGAGTLDVVAGASRARLDLTASPVLRSVALDLPPGTTTVRFTSSIPAGAGEFSFRLDDFLVNDAG